HLQRRVAEQLDQPLAPDHVVRLEVVDHAVEDPRLPPRGLPDPRGAVHYDQREKRRNAEDRRIEPFLQAHGRRQRRHGGGVAGRHPARARQPPEVDASPYDQRERELHDLYGDQREHRQDEWRVQRDQCIEPAHRSLSTAYRASASSAGESTPTSCSAAIAASASSRARLRAPSTPRSDGYVAFASAWSRPAVFPSASVLPTTSSTSSAIWNARPSLRP